MSIKCTLRVTRKGALVYARTYFLKLAIENKKIIKRKENIFGKDYQLNFMKDGKGYNATHEILT